MKVKLSLVLLTVTLFFAQAATGQQHITMKLNEISSSIDLEKYLDLTHAKINGDDSANVECLIQTLYMIKVRDTVECSTTQKRQVKIAQPQLANTVQNDQAVASPEPVKKKNFYCIIHILRWSNPPKTGDPTVQAQSWYLYHDGKLEVGGSDPLRIYGVKNVGLLLIHLNKGLPKNDEAEPKGEKGDGKDENVVNKSFYETVDYEVTVTKKTPTYLQHFLELLGVAFPSKNASILDFGDHTGNWYGAALVNIDKLPADVVIKPQIIKNNGDTVAIATEQKFDDEAKYMVDFSIGIPINKARADQVSFDAATRVLSPKEVHRDSAYAFFNFYPVPVDLKKTFTKYPHFVGGVGLTNQPLHRIFLGGGYGPLVANFYAGVLLSKDQLINGLPPSDTNINGPITYKYKPHFAFGFNLPVGAIASKLK